MITHTEKHDDLSTPPTPGRPYKSDHGTIKWPVRRVCSEDGHPVWSTTPPRSGGHYAAVLQNLLFLRGVGVYYVTVLQRREIAIRRMPPTHSPLDQHRKKRGGGSTFQRMYLQRSSPSSHWPCIADHFFRVLWVNLTNVRFPPFRASFSSCRVYSNFTHKVCKPFGQELAPGRRFEVPKSGFLAMWRF